MPRRSLTSRISDIEDSTLHWGYYLVTFLALVVVRNLLEGALGPDHILGFVHFASRSALMVLDHFVLFYVSLFLSFSILLSLLARERIGRVMKVVTPAWVLVLIPPVLDFIVTAGRGTRITYVLDLSPVLLRFFDPTVVLERVSTGQRVEILLACLLAAVYVWIKSRNWFRTLLSFAGIYLLIAFHGVWPSLFAKAAWWVTGGSSTTAAAAYDAAFKSAGIVLEESRKLALLFLYASIPLGWIALRMHASTKAGAVCSNVRLLRSLHYMGMTVFGAALGWVIFASSGVQLGSGGDMLGVLGVSVATFFAFQASVALNDLFDQEADRIAEPRRPLVTGVLERRDLALQAIAFAGIALLIAINVKYATFLLMLLALAVSIVYSAPPLRLKRIPIVATLTLGLVSYLAVLIGFSAFAEERSMSLFPSRLGWMLVLSFGFAFTAKDLKDIEADRATGTLTLPVLLGPRLGRASVAALVFLGYLLVPVFLPYPMLGAPAVVFGAGSAALIYLWKRPRVDNVLLGLYLVFAFLAALVIGFGADRILTTGQRLPLEAGSAEFQGRRAEAADHWDEAAKAYARAAEIAPGDSEILEQAGVAFFNSGRMDEAARFLAGALEVNPASSISLEYRAIAEMNLGLSDAATDRMTHAVEAGIRPALFLSHLGELFLQLGDPGAARRSLKRALHLGQPDLPARLRYADALAASGKTQDALEQYEDVASRNPASAEARDAIGRFHHSTGNTEQALAELRAAVGLKPDEPLYWNNLAVAYRDLQLYEEAMDALDYAIRLDPGLVDAYFNRGQVYEAMGRRAEARKQYLLALEIDPEFTPARQALSETKEGLRTQD